MQDVTSTPQPVPPAASPDFTLPVDPEHIGLRITIVGVFVFAAIIIYLLTNALVPQAEGANFIAIIAGLGGAAAVTQIVDRVFKQRWPSGRFLRIDGDQLYLVLRGAPHQQIDGAQHVNVLLWRFEVTRRTRVPKGWYMVAIALHQEDTYLPLYTFIAPEQFAGLRFRDQYVKLSPKKEGENQDLRLAGQQRRLRIAEDARWAEGAELTPEHYNRLIDRLCQQFGQWMPVE